MEYLLVMAFAFLMLAVIITIGLSESASFSGDVAATQIRRVGDELAASIDAIYYAGPPAKQTILLSFPDRIDTVTFDNQSIVFGMQGNGGPYEYSVATHANLTGELRPFAGLHRIAITAIASGVNVTG
jgi:hypothetical protein